MSLVYRVYNKLGSLYLFGITRLLYNYMTFGRLTKRFGPQKFGQLAGWYNPNTIKKYPPGVACILTDAPEINIDDWQDDNTGNQSNLTTTVGEMKTVIGVYYPSFYSGVRGNWTETEIREALTNDLEEAIFNFSDGNTKLVGPNGGQVMIDGVHDLWCTPNTNTASDGLMMPCNSTAGAGAITRARQAMQSACPQCTVRAALILGCPRGYVIHTPGMPHPLAGIGYFANDSVTWTDGMEGWNYAGTQDTCAGAHDLMNDPGDYILEYDIELIKLGRVKRVMLHEIMHTLNFGHCNKPRMETTWCPHSFKLHGPIPPCDDGNDYDVSYLGSDNLGLMSQGGGCNNPYNVFEQHPTASTKYLRGLGLPSPGPSSDEGDDGIWLPDDAVLSLDPTAGETYDIRLYAHDTPVKVKENTLRDITTGAVSDAIGTGPSARSSSVPYLIKIKRPISLEHCAGDMYCLKDHDLFISYRREAWYNIKRRFSVNQGANLDLNWDEGGYQNGAMIIDWGPMIDPNGAGPGALSLYKYDAADVKAPNSTFPNQRLDAYYAEDGSPNSTTTGVVRWPKLEIRILENVGNNAPAHGQNPPYSYSGQGPLSIVVQIKAL